MENTIKINNSRLQDIALLVMRIIIAIIFIYAGLAKWTFWSSHPAEMTDGMLNLIKFLSIVEPLGAVALVVGFLTRWAAAGLANIMLGAIFVLKFTMQIGFFTSPTGVGLDYNLLIFGGCIALMTFGAGSWSLDKLLLNKSTR